MKTLHTAVAVVGIAAAAALAWWYQNRDGAAARSPAASSTAVVAPARQAAGGPVPVEVGKAVAMRIEDDAQAIGSLRAHQGVMLRPEVSGRVAKVGFADGKRVRRGQLLVQLDDTLEGARLEQA